MPIGIVKYLLFRSKQMDDIAGDGAGKWYNTIMGGLEQLGGLRTTENSRFLS